MKNAFPPTDWKPILNNFQIARGNVVFFLLFKHVECTSAAVIQMTSVLLKTLSALMIAPDNYIEMITIRDAKEFHRRKPLKLWSFLQFYWVKFVHLNGKCCSDYKRAAQRNGTVIARNTTKPFTKKEAPNGHKSDQTKLCKYLTKSINCNLQLILFVLQRWSANLTRCSRSIRRPQFPMQNCCETWLILTTKAVWREQQQEKHKLGLSDATEIASAAVNRVGT